MKVLRSALVVGLLFTAACSQLGSSQIEIRNSGHLPLKAMDVQLGGKRYSVDLIEPNSVAKITFEPVSDSAVRINYMLGQEPHVHTCLGDVYVTTGPSMQISVIIGSDGTCEVIDKRRE